MKSEKEKMLAGEPYLCSDPQLVVERSKAHNLCYRYNATTDDQSDLRAEILRNLFGCETGAFIQAPFYCDYGANIKLGKNVYMNFNCCLLDVCQISIGDNCFFAPNVQIYTATHPLNAIQRRSTEFGEPITIGDDVWIGGGSIICPGVSIGSRVVIGAGSVVTKDIPADSLAVGNPCRVIRSLK